MSRVFWRNSTCCFLLASLSFGIAIQAADPEPSSTPAPLRVSPNQAEQIGKGEEFQKQSPPKRKPDDRSQDRASSRAGDTQPADNLSHSGTAKSNPLENKAFERIGAEIRDAVQLRKTLVIFLVEQTADAAALSQSVSDEILHWIHDLRPNEPDRLKMAIFSYGASVKLLTPEPVDTAASLESAVSELRAKPRAAESVLLFTAVNQAIDRFLAYRKQGYEVLFVVAGVSSASDMNQADEAIAALKRSAISVFGIGPAAPFSRPFRNRSSENANPTLESLYPERVQLALFDKQGSADLTDSGYGPFGLERICRQTGGTFFRIRSGVSRGWQLDSATGDIKADLLDKYAPDYVDDNQYKQLLAENKCRQALHNAALLPPTFGLDANVRTFFPKEKDEATLARNITIAQRSAAERDQPLQQLYDAMTAGEADRSKLTGARWQANYDLAIGLVLAAKARLDGYNTLLAVLKQGKSFTNPKSTRWELEPADDIALASTLDKMAKNSRIYLERVVADHKGSPWAAIAERELRHPAGWKLVEHGDDDAPNRARRPADR